MPHPIYMDHHATTPVDPRVVEAMVPWFAGQFGNAASRTHAYGWAAAEAVERARRQVAALVGVSAREIVFTSGATEANNLAIKGVAAAARARGDHLVTVATEHRAVLDPCRRLAREGWRVTYLPVAGDGLLDPNALRAALTDRTLLVSVMSANNEIGVLQPLADVVAIAHERGALVHTDAAQEAGAVPFDARALDVDLVSLSAHKLYGPKGVGALVVRRRTPPIALEPLFDGGGHERGLRSGTLNVPGIVGFGLAAEIAAAGLAAEAARVAALRDRLLDGLRAEVGGVTVNGSLARRLPHNLHVSFDGIEGEALLMAIGDLAVSAGAACSSASDEPSHVLAALGVGDALARASLRFGLGRGNTAGEVDAVVARLATVVARLRARRQSRFA
jgi:cysteine desulfurase